MTRLQEVCKPIFKALGPERVKLAAHARTGQWDRCFLAHALGGGVDGKFMKVGGFLPIRVEDPMTKAAKMLDLTVPEISRFVWEFDSHSREVKALAKEYIACKEGHPDDAA